VNKNNSFLAVGASKSYFIINSISKISPLPSSTFRQFIIDHATINSPSNTLKDIIRSNQINSTTIKTLVRENIFPKITHTLLTAYYSSHIEINIPQVTNTSYKPLIYYYCTDESYAAIIILVINSTVILPQLYIIIYNSSGNIYKEYTIAANNPKVIIDLTAYLADARSRQKIVSTMFAGNIF
jgi:hypothetical protein